MRGFVLLRFAFVIHAPKLRVGLSIDRDNRAATLTHHLHDLELDAFGFVRAVKEFAVNFSRVRRF